MRISTGSIYQQGVYGIQQQQSELAQTQQQIATGKRVNSAGDDPVATVQLQALKSMQAQQEQFAKNSTAAEDRLQLSEQSMADATNVLQRIRDLTLQANTATVTAADRQSLGREIRSRIEELQGIANRRDNNGDFLFAGFSSRVQPYVTDASGVISYQGDSGQRSVLIDNSVAVPDGDPGANVFGSIKSGNGVFSTSVTATNTGNGVVDTGSVTNLSNWDGGNYTIAFTSPTQWQVTDSANAVVGSGTYTSASAIAFKGIQVSISGAPATGDSFQVNASTLTDAFAPLLQLANTLSQSSDSEAVHAQIQSSLTGSLQQLDQTIDHFATVRATIGTRLSLIADVSATRDSRQADVSASISQLQDLDYASAVSRMQQQLLGLQAAQQAYAKTVGLSLFNYL